MSCPEASGAADVGVILVAAGSGSRFGGKKQFAAVGGKPLLAHSLELFRRHPAVRQLVVVVPERDLGAAASLAAERAAPGGSAGPPPAACVVIAGGARRQDSVRRGIEGLDAGVRWAVVHDAARPLLQRADFDRFLAALRQRGAAVIGHPASDSVKEERDGWVERNLPRERIWQVQTPQGAVVESLRRAFEAAEREGFEATDEASLLERLGVPVALVEGPRDNFKITFPEDLAIAELIFSRRAAPLADS
jgi:2-C-methyl-D-erythritol 4-phosphate cytidylyltransferase